MAKRYRRPPEPGEYEDPLSNYDPPEFEDEFEKSLRADAATRIEHRPFLAVPANETVRSALAMMAERDVACIVVVNDEAEPIGIFSERDVLNRVAASFEQTADQPVGGVMTGNPTVVYGSDPPAKVLNVMVNGGFRHVPVVDADGKLMGVIGARRMIGYLQDQFPEAVGH
jgi:CBS domain-containing protein